MNTINATIKNIENLCGGFNSGKIYSICSRPGDGKTQLCLRSTIHLANKGRKILYISDAMDIDKFYTKLTDRTEDIIKENITFAECYYLTIDKLKEFLNKSRFDFLILDPFDIYCYDLDIGQLKDFAKSNNLGIFITKTIPFTRENDKRNNPWLSDMKFPDKKTEIKFIAYSDVEILAYKKVNNSKLYVKFGKNLYNGFSDELELDE